MRLPSSIRGMLGSLAWLPVALANPSRIIRSRRLGISLHCPTTWGLRELQDGPVDWHTAFIGQEYIVCRFNLPPDRARRNYADHVDMAVVKVAPDATLDDYLYSRLQVVQQYRNIETIPTHLGALPGYQISFDDENAVHACREFVLFGQNGDAVYVLHFRSFLEYRSDLTQHNLVEWHRMARSFRTQA